MCADSRLLSARVVSEHLLSCTFEQSLSHLKHVQSTLNADQLIEQALLLSLDLADFDCGVVSKEQTATPDHSSAREPLSITPPLPSAPVERVSQPQSVSTKSQAEYEREELAAFAEEDENDDTAASLPLSFRPVVSHHHLLPPPPPASPVEVTAPSTSSISSASAPSSCHLLSRLAPVELQLCLQYLDAKSLLRAANTCSRLKREVEQPFVWRFIECGPGPEPPVVFCLPVVSADRHPHHAHSKSAFLSPLLRRFLPIRVYIDHAALEEVLTPDALATALASLSNVTALDGFFSSQFFNGVFQPAHIRRYSAAELAAALKLECFQKLRWAAVASSAWLGDGDDALREELMTLLMRLPALESLTLDAGDLDAPLPSSAVAAASQLRHLTLESFGYPWCPLAHFTAFGEAKVPLESLTLDVLKANTEEELQWWKSFDRLPQIFRLDALVTLSLERAINFVTRDQLVTIFRACISLRSLEADSGPCDVRPSLKIVLRALLRLACEEQAAHRPRPLTALRDITLTFAPHADELCAFSRSLLRRFFSAYPQLASSHCEIIAIADEHMNVAEMTPLMTDAWRKLTSPQRVRGLASVRTQFSSQFDCFKRFEFAIRKPAAGSAQLATAVDNVDTAGEDHGDGAASDSEVEPDEYRLEEADRETETAAAPSTQLPRGNSSKRKRHEAPLLSPSLFDQHPPPPPPPPAASPASVSAPSASSVLSASASSSVSCLLLSRLASVEVQLCFQYLDAKSLLRAANTCRRLKREVEQPFVWRVIEQSSISLLTLDNFPRCFDSAEDLPSSTPLSSAFLSPLLRRYAPIRVTVSKWTKDSTPLAVDFARFGLGNVIELRGLFLREPSGVEWQIGVHQQAMETWIVEALLSPALAKVRCIDLGYVHLPRLQHALFALPSLTELELHCAAVTSPLLKAAVQQAMKLRSLKLHEFGWHDADTLSTAEPLFSAFAEVGQQLDSLHIASILWFNQLEVDAIPRLFRCDALRSLTFGREMIRRITQIELSLCTLLRSCSNTLRYLAVEPQRDIEDVDELLQGVVRLAQEESEAGRAAPLSQLQEIQLEVSLRRVDSPDKNVLKSFFNAYPAFYCHPTRAVCLDEAALSALDAEHKLFPEERVHLTRIPDGVTEVCFRLRMTVYSNGAIVYCLRRQPKGISVDASNPAAAAIASLPPAPAALPPLLATPQLPSLSPLASSFSSSSTVLVRQKQQLSREMALVELQHCMQWMDAKSLLRFGTTCSQLRREVENPRVWRFVRDGPESSPPVVLRLAPPPDCGVFQPHPTDETASSRIAVLSPLLRRHLPIRIDVPSIASEIPSQRVQAMLMTAFYSFESEVSSLGNIVAVESQSWRYCPYDRLHHGEEERARESWAHRMAMLLSLPVLQRVRSVVIDSDSYLIPELQRAIFSLPRLTSVDVDLETQLTLLPDACRRASGIRELKLLKVGRSEQQLVNLAALGAVRWPLQSLHLDRIAGSHGWTNFATSLSQRLRLDTLQSLHVSAFSPFQLKDCERQLVTLLGACVTLRSLTVTRMKELDSHHCWLRAITRLARLGRKSRNVPSGSISSTLPTPPALSSLQEIRLIAGLALATRSKRLSRTLLRRFYAAYPHFFCQQRCVVVSAGQRADNTRRLSPAMVDFWAEPTRTVGMAQISLSDGESGWRPTIEFVFRRQTGAAPKPMMSPPAEDEGPSNSDGDLEEEPASDADENEATHEALASAPPPPAALPVAVAAPSFASVPSTSASSSSLLLSRLASVEVQLCLQLLDAKSLLRAANTCTQLRRKVDEPFVWKCIESSDGADSPVCFQLSPPAGSGVTEPRWADQPSSAFLSPSTLR